MTAASRVEPEWAVVTIVFADLRGFTALAERSTAHEAVAVLDGFFRAAVPAVLAYGGEVHKLLGDGLLALFVAPGHADAALAAGRALVKTVEMPVGVGINSGLVLRGTIGGGGVTELGVVGDPVNVAARVQAATQELGEPLLVTEATRVLLDHEHPELEPRATLRLRGRAREIAVHAPVTIPGRPPAKVVPGWPS